MSYRVSVLIPIFNEIRFLESCLNSIINGSENFNEFEVFLIDGGSTDGTIELIKKLEGEYDNVFYFHNHKKFAPSAMNIGINNSSTDYIVRLDAHAIYPPQYIEKLVRILREHSKNVANVGGRIETKPLQKNLISNSIAYALSSKFGVGNSSFRTEIPKKITEVDTVPFGCFNKEALIKVGMYNESEVRGEDLDLNTRLRKIGYKIILAPEITSTYYSRDNYILFVKQAFKNGATVFRKFRGKKSYHKYRHYVPILFIIYQLIFFINLGMKEFYLINNLIYLVAILYAALSIIFSINLVLKEKNILFIFSTPIIFFTLHSTYGLGSFFAIIKNFLNRTKRILL